MRLVATGFLLLAVLIYGISTFFGQLHPSMGYVAAFSEAAVVGAIADWFAVVALFRHPLHLKFIPHTAILPANKGRIAKGLSEFILQNFLSAEAIVAKIAEIGPAGKLRAWLLQRENAQKIAALTTRFLSYGMGVFDDERVRRFVHAAVVSKLQEIDVAAAAGQVLDVLTEDKRHHAVLDEVLRLVDEAMASGETRDYIAKAVAAESPLIDAIRRMGWQLDETIARKIINGVARTIEEVRNDPDHALRRRFDEFIAEYIDKLKRDKSSMRIPVFSAGSTSRSSRRCPPWSRNTRRESAISSKTGSMSGTRTSSWSRSSARSAGICSSYASTERSSEAWSDC